MSCIELLSCKLYCILFLLFLNYLFLPCSCYYCAAHWTTMVVINSAIEIKLTLTNWHIILEFKRFYGIGFWGVTIVLKSRACGTLIVSWLIPLICTCFQKHVLLLTSLKIWNIYNVNNFKNIRNILHYIFLYICVYVYVAWVNISAIYNTCSTISYYICICHIQVCVPLSPLMFSVPH